MVEGSVGDTKGTGVHTVMTHGTPTLFPHKAHMGYVQFIYIDIHIHTNTAQLMHV